MADQIEQIVTALTGCCAECADRAEHIAYAILEHAPAGLLAAPEHDAAVAAGAWSEGFGAGRSADHNSMWWPPNPYRIERGGDPTP